MANETVRDLRPLAACAELRELIISGFSSLRDMSGLAGSSIDDLSLLMIARPARGNPDLETLAGTALSSLSLRHPGLSRGLHVLPADLPLTTLAIHNQADRRSLVGIERFPRLEKVTVVGVLGAEDVAALGQLPQLRHLALHDPHPLADLDRLRPLAGRLDILELFGFDESGFRSAAEAVGGDLAADCGPVRVRGRAAVGVAGRVGTQVVEDACLVGVSRAVYGV